MKGSAEPGGIPGLYRLLAWASPSFPSGAFSYSHGLEAAVEEGTVHDRASLEMWIACVVAYGSGRTDADILRDAHRAAEAADMTALDAANRRGIAFRATAELALESAQQGTAFLATCRAAWPDPLIEFWSTSPHPPSAAADGPPSPAVRERGLGGVGAFSLSRIAGEGGSGRSPESGEGVCHSAVFGAVAARSAITLEDALLGYLHAFAGNLVSAGLRLGIVGQTDGQRILAALERVVAAATRAALARVLADFGSATFAVDLASMAHETQYSRLFRS